MNVLNTWKGNDPDQIPSWSPSNHLVPLLYLMEDLSPTKFVPVAGHILQAQRDYHQSDSLMSNNLLEATKAHRSLAPLAICWRVGTRDSTMVVGRCGRTGHRGTISWEALVLAPVEEVPRV